MDMERKHWIGLAVLIGIFAIGMFGEPGGYDRSGTSEQDCEVAYREVYIDDVLTQEKYCENYNKEWP